MIRGRIPIKPLRPIHRGRMNPQSKYPPRGRVGQQVGEKPSFYYVRAKNEALRKRQLEAKKQKQKEAAVNKIMADIKAGRITSEGQIPSAYRKYFNIPADYFQKRREALAQLRLQQIFKKWLKKSIISQQRFGWIPSMPRELKGTPYERKAKGIEQMSRPGWGTRGIAEIQQPKINYFTSTKKTSKSNIFLPSSEGGKQWLV